MIAWITHKFKYNCVKELLFLIPMPLIEQVLVGRRVCFKSFGKHPLSQITCAPQFYTSFKRTVHPSNFENKHFLLNACLFSRVSSSRQGTNKGSDNGMKYEVQVSNSKSLFLDLPGCIVSLKEV